MYRKLLYHMSVQILLVHVTWWGSVTSRCTVEFPWDDGTAVIQVVFITEKSGEGVGVQELHPVPHRYMVTYIGTWWMRKGNLYYCIQGYFRSVIFSLFFTCNWCRSVLTSPRQLWIKKDSLRNRNSTSFKFVPWQRGRNGRK